MLSAALLGGCASSHPDEHPNVTAATAAGKTVTGKVISFTDSSLTLETTTGNEVIGITSETEGRDNLIVGASVAVDFQRTSAGGEPVASRIRPVGGT